MTNFLGCIDNQGVEILRAWDKISKVGLESTAEELKAKGLPQQVISNYQSFTQELLAANQKFDYLQKVLGPNGENALNAIGNIFYYALSMGVPKECILFNPLLARGLDYYTGPIFEIVIEQSGIGSISGGGRFDDLIETLGGPSLPASGSSFGLDRVISVMDQLGIQIPVETSAPVFITIFDQNNLDLVQYSFQIASNLRLDGIPVEVYTGNNPKLGKQIEIGNKKGARIIIILGPEELAKKLVSVKILSTAEQYKVPVDKISEKIRSLLSS